MTEEVFGQVTLVCTGDIHLSNTLPHAKPGPGGRTDRLADQVAMMKALLEDAAEQDATVILGGDVFDESVLDGATLDAALEIFTSSKVPLLIGPGNHEAKSPRGGHFVSEFIRRLDHRRIEWIGQNAKGEPKRILEHLPSWLRAWWVDYCPPDEAAHRIDLVNASRGAVSTKEGGPIGASLLFLHHAIKGCKDGGWTCDDGLDGARITENFTAVVSGHFHDTQRFGPATAGTWPHGHGMFMGAPMQHDFGDADKRIVDDALVTARDIAEPPLVEAVLPFEPGRPPRGWWRIRVDPRVFHGAGPKRGGIYFEQVKSSTPTFHETIAPSGCIMRAEPTRIFPAAKPADYAKLSVVCTHAEWATCEADWRRFGDECRRKLQLRLCVVQPSFTYHRGAVTARLGGGAEKADKRELIPRYVDTVGEGDLDRDRLIEVGRSLLEETEAES